MGNMGNILDNLKKCKYEAGTFTFNVECYILIHNLHRKVYVLKLYYFKQMQPKTSYFICHAGGMKDAL